MSQESRDDTGRPNLSRVEFPRHGAVRLLLWRILGSPRTVWSARLRRGL